MKTHNVLLLLGAVLISTHALAGGGHADGHAHAASAIGAPGKPDHVSRTVEVEMSDSMRFKPEQIVVVRGETLRFIVKNTGQLKHELVLGQSSALKEHAKLMQKFPGMEHADDNMVSVAPGQQGTLLWQFSRAGTVHFACLQPGHYEAGMKGVVKVQRPK